MHLKVVKIASFMLCVSYNLNTLNKTMARIWREKMLAET